MKMCVVICSASWMHKIGLNISFFAQMTKKTKQLVDHTTFDLLKVF